MELYLCQEIFNFKNENKSIDQIYSNSFHFTTEFRTDFKL